MGTTTTPEQDPDERRKAKLALSSRYGKYADPDADPIETPYVEPATGRSDAVRLIQTTDELLSEVLRRPGQLFIVSHGLRAMRGSSTLEQWTYIEFANGDKVEVRYAR